ncbi:unnamed protein product [Peronospora farinosa]|uniref:Clathrin adaptor alpha/beta/gamma-adaptin appendage Ig-like subdomain domain-containing protein n=1 Tax=Peronospora farinosa TaxID=134698 RepID=A0AAV0UIM2_9STRA|nr:unnamed protein product [Peronospora farinosa]
MRRRKWSRRFSTKPQKIQTVWSCVTAGTYTDAYFWPYPDVVHAVVLAEKPVISDDTCALEPSVLDELIGKISTLASVYHKLPSAFVVRSTVPEVHGHRQDGDYSVDGEGEGSSDQTEDGRIGQKAGDPVDLLDMAPPAPVAVSGAAVQKKLLMDALPGKGLVMTGAFTRHSSNFVLDVDLENQSSAPITGVSIQFNKSTFGVVPMQAPITFPQPLAPGQTVNQVVPMSVSPQFVDAAVAPNLNLQVAI